MRHSRIFIAVTTACLAIAGVAAAKANFSNLRIGYYDGQGNGHCSYTSVAKGVPNGTQPLITQNATVHASKSTTNCSSSKLFVGTE